MQTESLSKLTKLLITVLLPAVLYVIPLENICNGNTICIFKNLFGVECWGCGITRAVFSALHFRFQDAWEYNPLFVVVLPLLVFLWMRAVVRVWRL
jgi:hypothetical protein